MGLGFRAVRRMFLRVQAWRDFEEFQRAVERRCGFSVDFECGWSFLIARILLFGDSVTAPFCLKFPHTLALQLLCQSDFAAERPEP